MPQALGISSRRSLLLPILVSLGIHGLLGALVFWQASQNGWSSESPVGIEGVYAGTEDEGGTIDLIVASSRTKPEKSTANGNAEESSIDDSFVQLAHIGTLPDYKETKDVRPVVKHPDQNAKNESVGTGSSSQGNGTSGTPGTGSSPGEGSLPRGLFPTIGANQSIVYLIDQSISMGLSGGLDIAKREVLHRVARLPESARFQVIFYNNHQVEALKIDGDQGLLPASESVKAKARVLIDRQRAKDGTLHLEALMTALRLRPTVIVLITDADDLSPELVKKITGLNEQRCVIHTIELARKKGDADSLLAILARRNGGRYQCLD
jgi:hypothetical protein